MKKNIIGLAVVVLALLGSEGLKAQRADCLDPDAWGDNYKKKINTNKKITLVNSLDKAVYFNLGVYDGEDIGYRDFAVGANSDRIIPYCVKYDLEQLGYPAGQYAKRYIKNVKRYMIEGAFSDDGIDETKIKNFDLTDKFKKLQDRESFNLVITVNEVGKDPVVEIK